MYAKIFAQILDSSIARDVGLRRMFIDMLILANSDGDVDMTPFAIAQRLVLPEEEVRTQISKLCLPDPDSRSKDMDGRRLVLIDDHRSWGWRIVNYDYYRKMVNEEGRRERNRESCAKWRAKTKVFVSSDFGVCRSLSPDVATPVRQKKTYQEEAEEEEYTDHTATNTSATDVAGVTVRQESNDDQLIADAQKLEQLQEPEPQPEPKKAQSVLPGFEAPTATQLEDIYWAYPRHIGKVEALKAIKKALQYKTYEVLMERTKLYRASSDGNPSGPRAQFIPHPATWFNQGRYDDDPTEWNRKETSDKQSLYRPTSVIPTDESRAYLAKRMAERAAEEMSSNVPI